MLSLRWFVLMGVALAIVCTLPVRAADPAPLAEPTTLTPDDRAFLERVYTVFGIVDPRGAVRVRVKRKGQGGMEVDYGAWLLPSRDGQPEQAVFANGLPVPLPKEGELELKPMDFLAAFEAVFTGDPSWHAIESRQKQIEPQSARAPLQDPLTTHQSTLVIAAWLMRLGRENLAATALARYQAHYISLHGDWGPPPDSATDPYLSDIPNVGKRFTSKWQVPARPASREEAMFPRLREVLIDEQQRLLEVEFTAGRDAQAYAAATWMRAHNTGVGVAQDWQTRERILADLDRRRALGRFGVIRKLTLPEDFAAWPVEQRLAWLIDAMDDIHVEIGGQTLRQNLMTFGPIGRGLYDLGDAAVPALIELVESDQRLTRITLIYQFMFRIRSTGEERPFPTIMPVSQLAACILRQILRIDDLAYYLPEYTHTSYGPPEVSAAAFRLYWARYGHLPLDQRLMAMLTDPKADPVARRECANNLGKLNVAYKHAHYELFEKAMEMGFIGPNPLATAQGKPTAAEAIVAAMAEDLRAIAPGIEADYAINPKDSYRESRRRARYGVLDVYLEALHCLRDRRIAPALAARARTLPTTPLQAHGANVAAALGDFSALTALGDAWVRGEVDFPVPAHDDRRDPSTVQRMKVFALLGQSGERRFAEPIATLAIATADLRDRCAYTRAAMALGDTRALRQLAADTEAATIVAKKGDLVEVLDLLAESDLRAATQALTAVTTPGHPFYEVVYVMATTSYFHYHPWLRSPQGLALIDRGLTDTSPYSIKVVEGGESSSYYRLDPKFTDLNAQRLAADDSAPNASGVPNAPSAIRAGERVCDYVASYLASDVVGLPLSTRRQEDRAAAVAACRAFMARYGAHLEYRVPAADLYALSLSWTAEQGVQGIEKRWGGSRQRMVDLPPLDHAATAADLAAGRAVFHLAGRGTRVEMALPAWVEVPPSAADGRYVAGKVVQAERDADGQVYFGVMTNESLARLPASRVRLLTAAEIAMLRADPHNPAGHNQSDNHEFWRLWSYHNVF